MNVIYCGMYPDLSVDESRLSIFRSIEGGREHAIQRIEIAAAAFN